MLLDDLVAVGTVEKAKLNLPYRSMVRHEFSTV